MNTAYHIEPLKNTHSKNEFVCGVKALDNYLNQQAKQDIKRHIAATFVLSEANNANVIGYYTLSATGIDLGDLPETIVNKLPKYPVLPATLLGRLAVDRKYQGKGLGEILIIDAMKRSLLSSHSIGSMALIVDAKNNSVDFYKRYGFISFQDTTNKLFLPMTSIKKVWHAN